MMAMGWMVAAGLFVVGVAFTCIRALDGASAAARHAVWTVALTLLVALPPTSSGRHPRCLAAWRLCVSSWGSGVLCGSW